MSNPKFEKTTTHYKIDIEIECESCKGTGLYVGMAESGGAAVVCHTCKGTGKVHLRRSYRRFKERKRRDGVKRVYESAHGYGITAKDVVVEKTGETIHFSRFGCAYEDWLEGATPKPIEELHCPYMHTDQGMQHSDHPAYKLYQERCSALNLGSWISDCKNNSDKAACWLRYYELVGKINE